MNEVEPDRGAIVLRTPTAIDQALRDPALRVAGRDTWHDDPRVHDLIDRMPSMHDDESRRRGLVPVRALLSPDASRAATPVMQREMRALAVARPLDDPAVDLVESFTSLIAPTFLRSYLGLDTAVSAHDLRDFSTSLTAELVRPGTPDPDLVAVILDVSGRLREAVTVVRRSQAKGAGQAGPLGDLRRDHPLAPLIEAVPEDHDVAAIVCLLASGGQETVSSLTCSVLMANAQDPVMASRWRTDPVAVVDELADLLPPIMMLARRAEAATRTDGIDIPGGRTVLLDLASGAGGMAFGMGLHRCLGRSVARAIIPIAVNAVLDAHPSLRSARFRPEGRPVAGVFRGPVRLFADSPAASDPGWDALSTMLGQREG